jgi:predicted XRE-type DNA-binding protein
MISELPSLITEYKIINSLTQRQLAEILGIKEQQLQRHESNGFKSVTFKNLLKFLDLIGLEVTIKDTRMTRTYRKIIKKKKTNS